MRWMRCFVSDFPWKKNRKIGVKLGADIPYCLMGGTALSEGIGEILAKTAGRPEGEACDPQSPIWMFRRKLSMKICMQTACNIIDIDGMICEHRKRRPLRHHRPDGKY